jgi:hypothetical protein
MAGRTMTRAISTAATDSASLRGPAPSHPLNRRARLLASSMLCGGTLRGLAAAAGMMTALGVSPAFAQCYSTATFTPQSVCRLLLIDRDVTAGVYPMKNFNWPAEGLPAGTTRQQFEDRYTEYPFNPIGHGAERVSSYADADGFVEVAEAPTGFMCIKREVFRQMMEKYPKLNYVPDGPPNPQANLHWLFFDCMVDPDDGRYLSEDYAFCRRWRDIGGKIWIDLQCKLMHLGQHNFRGDLAESLKLQGRW